MLLFERENQGGYPMSALVLLPGEGKAVQLGGLGGVFKLFGIPLREDDARQNEAQKLVPEKIGRENDEQ